MISKKKRSKKQEYLVADMIGGRVVPASGSKWFAKSDVRSDKFLVECKTTKKDFYPLTATTWEKIELEATRDHLRIPLMMIDLEDRDRVVVFRPQDFSTPLPTPFENFQGTGIKSCRISVSYLKDCEKSFGEYFYGKLFIICGNKKNMLMYMRANDFKEIFKKELKWERYSRRN